MPEARGLDAAGVEMILGWAAEEGWNPGIEDAAAFHAADPEGFFLVEHAGAPAAAVSVVNHGPDFAFLGLYLCRPEVRGRGLGLAVWEAALAHAGERVVGLDGVPAQQGNYRKSGFEPADSTLRMEGRLAPGAEAGVRAFREADLAALTAMDAAANGYGKPAFLAAWLGPRETRRTVVLEGPDGPEGFATARLCRRGAKIGPLIAPDAEAALRLARAALAAVGGDGEAIVDVSAETAAMRGALAAEGFAETFPTARMYRGPAPRPAVGAGPKAMGAGTLELG